MKKQKQTQAKCNEMKWKKKRNNIFENEYLSCTVHCCRHRRLDRRCFFSSLLFHFIARFLQLTCDSIHEYQSIFLTSLLSSLIYISSQFSSLCLHIQPRYTVQHTNMENTTTTNKNSCLYSESDQSHRDGDFTIDFIMAISKLE